MSPDKISPADPVTVVLPLRFRLLQLPLGMFWLVLGISHFWPTGKHSRGLTALFEILIGMYFLWSAMVRCVVTVSPDSFSVRISGLGFGWTRSYVLTDISDLRVHYERVFTYRPMLAFNRNSKSRIVGRIMGLYLDAGASSDELFEPIYKRFPTLRPSPATSSGIIPA